MSLEEEILSFVDEKWQNLPLLGKTREWYRYQKLVVPVPIVQRGFGTGTHFTVKDWYRYRCSQQPYFCILCTIKSRVHTPIVKER